MKKRLLYLFSCMHILLPFYIWGEEGFSQALKISLTGKIYKKLSFVVEEDLRSAIDFSQMQRPSSRAVRLYFLSGSVSRVRMPSIENNQPAICDLCLQYNITFLNLIFIRLYMQRLSTTPIGEVWLSTAFAYRPDVTTS